MSNPVRILHKGPQNKNAQDSINAPNTKKRGISKKPIDASPNPKDATAPTVNAIKDEIELLRSGVKNKVGFIWLNCNFRTFTTVSM